MPYHGGYVSPTRPNPNGPNDASIIIYGYIPSTTLSILSIVIFSFAFILHTSRILFHRLRLYAFSLPLIVACLMEAIGYTFRLLSERKDPYRIDYFVIQYFLIVTAPVCISAAIYYTLTMLVRADSAVVTGVWQSRLLRPKRILWTFITADAICTIVQVTGASLIGKRTSKHLDPSWANDILLAGLAVQTCFFAVFLILLCFYYYTSRQTTRTERPPRRFVISLTTAALLVFIRTIFRLIETAQGVFGYLSVHEAFFGTLEFAPIGVAILMLGTMAFPGGLAKNEEKKKRRRRRRKSNTRESIKA
ncbi:MAG: hypothetical protein Q9227_007691 [Pyrenula ochraceoflavens]